MVRRQVCYLRPRNGGSRDAGFGEPLVRRNTGLSRDTVGDKRLEMPFLAWSPAPKPKVVVSLGWKHRKASRNLPGSRELSWSRKELFRELVVGSASDPFVTRLGWLLREVCSQWNWAPGLGFWNNSPGGLHGMRCSLPTGLSKRAWQTCPSGRNCFYYCKRVHSFWSHVGEWTAYIDPKELLLLDVGYIVDNVDPPY